MTDATHLSKLRPEMDFPDHPFIVLAGIRRSGKSYWAKWCIRLLQKKREMWDRGFVFTQTKGSRQWDDVVPPRHQFDWHIEERLELLIEKQRQVIEQVGQENAPSILLVLDDVIGAVPADSDVFRVIATAGRHLKLTCFLLTQRFNAFRPVIRDQVDCLILFSQLDERTLDAVHGDLLAGLDLPRPLFNTIYRETAEGYRALALLRTTKTNSLEDHLFWTLAPE